MSATVICIFFFFNDTATTEIYTLSLHDALPICVQPDSPDHQLVPLLRDARADLEQRVERRARVAGVEVVADRDRRSEEHTSELQSRQYLVCRLLLEKKKKPN